MAATVYLVPVGPRRFDLYSEPAEDHGDVPPMLSGASQRVIERVRETWRQLLDRARAERGRDLGMVRRWRNSLVCHLAERVAEQQTLWALRRHSESTLRHPDTVDAASARTILGDVLAAARRHHGRWLLVDGALSLASGLLVILPGPNLVAYYFVFRFITHAQSWRAARHAAQLAWTFEPDRSLGELAALVDLPSSERAPLVAAIADRMNLPRLSAFFERAAARPA
jgi:hypothetical protein